MPRSNQTLFAIGNAERRPGNVRDRVLSGAKPVSALAGQQAFAVSGRRPVAALGDGLR
jgi:hypothetical protein